MKCSRSIALVLAALNVLQIPALASSIQRSLGGDGSPTVLPPCAPCTTPGAASNTQLEVYASIQSSLQNGGREPLASYPTCSGVLCQDADPQPYTWTVCRKTNKTPLKCQNFTHPFTVWFCPGHTWYKCTGTWSEPGADCTPCTSATPDTLPAGCTPDVPGGWEQCV